MDLKNNIEPGISFEGGGSSFTGCSHVPEKHEVMSRYLQVTFPDRVKDILLKDYYKSLLTEEELSFLETAKQTK